MGTSIDGLAALLACLELTRRTWMFRHGFPRFIPWRGLENSRLWPRPVHCRPGRGSTV